MHAAAGGDLAGLRARRANKDKKLMGQQTEEFLVQQVRDMA